MKNELISVIVPVYNGEKYIFECLNSLVNQSYKNIEIIVIDDGSTDNTKNECLRFSQEKRIHYFYQENQGVAAARNNAISKAKGKWVIFVDSDDRVSPYLCEHTLNAVINTKADMGMFKLSFVNEKGTLINKKRSYLNEKQYKEISKSEALSLILDDSVVGSYTCNKIYKKDLFNDLQFTIGKKFEDLGIMYKVVDRADKIAFIDEYLYFYFQRSDSLMHSTNIKDIKDAFDFRYNQFNFIEKKYPFLVNKALPAMIINSLQLIYKSGFRQLNADVKKARKFIKMHPIDISELSGKYRYFYFIVRIFNRL
ncbi:glycosyltransferase family 2 protein [Lactobacillus sp. PV037]|uniref:glycosyltransferase family 2 protein n=1 Tax=Lactobacillus sp. PV037 TaxID=2594496 RepID=UPI002240A236|nr:glycosyltransferase family 2 protein [Lactobacillus sp. PV037]QNQ83113.1 glycosyltransferase family 2 protein [Lactobacillus sp. PV037]